ncbi:MAG: hypothetical protein JWL65_1377, partial [Gammaproteobacteria bacterium]|nr:hypothetical protein [Gammaproteobacteria bacterium]
KQEKMLVFTQFQEATSPIATYLGNVFGREGLVSDKQLLDLVALDIHSARADT